MYTRRLQRILVAAVVGLLAGGAVLVVESAVGWGLAVVALLVASVAWLDRRALRGLLHRFAEMDARLASVEEGQAANSSEVGALQGELRSVIEQFAADASMQREQLESMLQSVAGGLKEDRRALHELWVELIGRGPGEGLEASLSVVWERLHEDRRVLDVLRDELTERGRGEDLEGAIQALGDRLDQDRQVLVELRDELIAWGRGEAIEGAIRSIGEGLDNHRQALRELWDDLFVRLEVSGAAGEDRHEALVSLLADLLDGQHPLERSLGSGGAAAVLDAPLDELPDADVVRQSGLFDPRWYSETHGVAGESDEEALHHYMTEGWRRGLAPSRWLDVDDYRRRVALRPDREPITDLLAREAAGMLPPARPRSVAPEDAAREARWADVVSGAHRWPRTFALYRILGNDLPPRHAPGQTRRNLEYILDHEPELRDCETWWIVNRIVDEAERTAIIDLLESRGQRYLVRPINPEREGVSPWFWRDSDREGEALFIARSDAKPRRRQMLDAYAHKIRALIDINGARNLALIHGRDRATWVLPWDGGCMLNEAAWDELIEAVESHPYVRYLVVPTERLQGDDLLASSAFRPPANDEPMVGFRRDARERFDPSRPYGDRDKVALLRKLGVPGPWDDWEWSDVHPRWGSSVDAGRFLIAGWQARLPAGEVAADRNPSDRWGARADALVRLVDRFDQEVTRRKLDVGQPITVDLEAIRAVHRDGAAPSGDVRALVDRARALMKSPDPEPGGTAMVSGTGPVDDLIALSLASVLEGSVAMAERASTLLPSAAGSGGDHGSRLGGPATAYVLDAARLIATEGADTRMVSVWAERRAQELNDHRDRHVHSMGWDGTWFDLEEASLAAYLGDAERVLTSLTRTEERLKYQLGPRNVPTAVPGPIAQADPESIHQILLLVQGWTLAAWLARSIGIELVDRDVTGRRLRWAFGSLFQHEPPNIDPDERMLRDRWYAQRSMIFDLRANREAERSEGEVDGLPYVFSPDAGIRPYWSIGSTPLLGV